MCEKYILGTINHTVEFDDLHMFLTFTKPALSSEGNTESTRLLHFTKTEKEIGAQLESIGCVTEGQRRRSLPVAFLECRKQPSFKDGSPTKN